MTCLLIRNYVDDLEKVFLANLNHEVNSLEQLEVSCPIYVKKHDI
jgi:hypothetical protein